MLQALCDLLKSSHVIWPREDPDKVMSLSDQGVVQTWSEEDLFEFRFSLRGTCEPVEQAIDRESLFARRRFCAGTMIEHVRVRLGLDDLE